MEHEVQPTKSFLIMAATEAQVNADRARAEVQRLVRHGDFKKAQELKREVRLFEQMAKRYRARIK